MPGDWDDPDEDDTGWPADDQPETAWAPTQYDEPMHEERWVPGGDWDPQPPVAEYEPPAPDTTPVPSVPVWVNVSNPAGSITVQASTGGRIQRVALSPEVARMPESQLAQQVLATAKLANLKGRAVQHLLIEQMLIYQGLDRAAACDYIEQHMQLPTPEESLAAESEARAQYLRGEY
ncbi:hypothetical protein EB75_17210 [Mycobacterium sp. ST-F2]|uniref:hypothetical protein n=1 Tax=Mycobacterium sp. ST-F2 TaxID=1490484 RepID=UPI00093B00BA|nr:hypothetical protein [Mycobacterium sp. ST-F2]OKH81373.1 hypothetical protein EB75_17210 [Mycobacterium sp. ST-F2]